MTVVDGVITAIRERKKNGHLKTLVSGQWCNRNHPTNLKITRRRGGAWRRVLSHQGVLGHGSDGRRQNDDRGRIVAAHLVVHGGLGVVLECDLDGRELPEEMSEAESGES